MMRPGLLLDLVLAIPCLAVLYLVGRYILLPLATIVLRAILNAWETAEREADRRWCIEHHDYIAPARGNTSNAFAELDPYFRRP